MNARTAARFAIGVAAIVLVGAACGGGSSSESIAGEPTAGASTPSPVTEPPDASGASEEPVGAEPAEGVAVPAALQFEAALVGGGSIDARTLAGKPTVFWFWAPT